MDAYRQLSYRAFSAWANCLVWPFKAKGVSHGDVVAVMLENCLELLAILAALSKLGALINTTQHGKVLAHSFNLVKTGLLVSGDELRPSIWAKFKQHFGAEQITGTVKYKKTNLKQAGYDPNQVDGPLYVGLPGSDSFQPLDGELHAPIARQAYRF